MSKSYLFLISLAFLFTFSDDAMAELANTGLEIGGKLGISYISPDTDESGIGPDGFFFIQTPIYDRIRANFGVGKGRVRDASFYTCVTPIGAQLLVYATRTDHWNAYLYGGGGILAYTVGDLPEKFDWNVDTQASTSFMNFGLGVTYKISDSWSFDMSAGQMRASTDELEGYVKDSNDNYLEVLAGLKYRIKLGSQDVDGDGIENDKELEIGTDPEKADTDGDGFNDGSELNVTKTDPLKADTDGDGLGDREEFVKSRTNALNPDTDGDGIQDGVEVNNYKTNPLKADSDDDGLSDFDEINTHKTSPTAADTDKDGLTDAEEVLKYKTNPLEADGDNDNLPDADEIKKYNTDPRNADSDNDKLLDGEEVNRYRTDPLSADTDNGSVDDYTEINRGTDPLSRYDDIIKEEVFEIEVGAKIVLEGIVFKSGSAEITPSSENILEKAYQTLKAYPKISVGIHGFTDNTGSLENNIRLSQARAESVKDWLAEKGISADRLSVKGFGPENPIAPNDTKAGRAKNRRIEFVREK